MSICGNFVELIEDHKVKNDNDFFILGDNIFSDKVNENSTFQVYIEKKILEDLSHKQLVIIDAAMGDINGNELGMLFIKPENDKYGI